MNKFATQLIKLGHQHPDLRVHLRPVLDEVLKVSSQGLKLNDLKLNSNTRIKVNEWMARFDHDAPAAEMAGGRGYFPANTGGIFQNNSRPMNLGDFRDTVAMGNNTILFGVASHDRRGQRFGRGFLTTMPSFDAANLARQGIECVRVDDAHHLWYCYIPFTYGA
jgi:hypothetical protein